MARPKKVKTIDTVDVVNTTTTLSSGTTTNPIEDVVLRETLIYPYPETREDHLALLKLLNDMGIDCGKLEVIISKIK